MSEIINFEFSVDKLRGKENFATWKFAMKTYLEHEELWKVVQGIEMNKKKNKKARASIVKFVDSVHLKFIENCKSAKEVWEKFEELFGSCDLKKRVDLLIMLMATKAENFETVQQYMDEISSIAHRLKDVGLEMGDEMIGCILLAGLSEENRSKFMDLENVKITTDVVKSRITQIMEKSNAEVSNGLALLVDQRKHHQKTIKKAKRCFACRSDEHLVKDCPKKSKKQKKPNMSFWLAKNEVDRYSWYLDSGATCHMTNNRKLLKNFKKLKDHVKVANDQQMEVEGIGTCCIALKVGNREEKVPVHDVLYVPDLSSNLLSVSKIAERGKRINFGESSCKIFQGSNLMAIGRKKNGLYKLCCRSLELRKTRQKTFKVVQKISSVPDEVGEMNKPLKNVTLLSSETMKSVRRVASNPSGERRSSSEQESSRNTLSSKFSRKVK